MKFAKYLESESIPEWRKAYLNYKGLKKKLKPVDKFRKASERKSAIDLDNTFHEYDSDSDQEYTGRKRHSQYGPPNATYHWRNAPLAGDDDPHSRRNSFPRSILQALTARFNKDDNELHRSPSRPVSIQSNTTLSVFDEVLLHASEPERAFFMMLNEELEKISDFYDEKERESREKLEVLKVQMQLVGDYGRLLAEQEPASEDSLVDQVYNPVQWFKRYYKDRKISLHSSMDYEVSQDISYNVARNRLKKALTEFYRSLEFLRSYKTLNETGFRKILKKFDKTAGWKASGLYTKRIKKYHWATSKDLDEIIKETETLYINEFADGHRGHGMEKLRVLERQETFTSTTWRVGLYLGLAIPLLYDSCEVAMGLHSSDVMPTMALNLQLYACFLIPILFCLGFSINLMVWHKSRINYKFIFELDPRFNLDYHQFAELPAFMLLLAAYIIHIDFEQTFAPTIPSELCPLLLFVLLSAIMLCPFDILYRSARKWLGVTLGRILLSYFYPVEFRDFFIADELNSLAYSIWTISYFACAYGWNWTSLDTNCEMTGSWAAPLLASLPPWWRLLQCIRRYRDSNETVHLVNGAKYLSSISASMVTGIRRFYPGPTMDILWIVVSTVSSCYTSTWDLKMDWGLFQSNSRNFLLRDEIVFHRWSYYTAASSNVVLRFGWVLNTIGLTLDGRLIGFIVALLEAYRRIQWNFFRLENEHINNCGQFRAIKEIPLPFALAEPVPGHDEEGSIHLPFNDPYLHSNPMSVPSTRQSSIYQSQPYGSMAGSFYGRRDFENRQDREDPNKEGSVRPRINRQASTINSVLLRIRSRRGSDASDSDPEDLYDNEEVHESQGRRI